MLRVNSVTKKYPGNKVPSVDNVSFEIKPGEIFGFIGSNGAGKTTTIKMMTGILSIDSGNVEIFGKDIEKDPEDAKRLFGYVSDNHEVYERLSGMEYLNFLANIYDVSKEDRKVRIEKYANLFDLSQSLTQPIKSYSHGMKQKLCIIGALLHNPKLWVLDEPMTGLDPQASHKLKELMHEHCAQGNIVFFSTHVLDVAEKLCDRVAVIDRGKILAVGTLEELRQKQHNENESLEDLFLSLVADPSEQ